MKLILLLLFALLAGAVLPVQAALNVKLGKAVGDPIYAAFLSFLVGAAGLFIYILVTNVELSQLSQASTLNWSVWTAGLLGAFYVGAVIILVPKIGAALTFGVIVAGQLGLSLLMDHYGWLGIHTHTISWQRIGGIILIIAGVVLIRNF